MRCGLLARELLSRRHSVTWVSSNFFHFTKSYRYSDPLNSLPRGLQIVLLRTTPYHKNVSIFRLINHQQYCVRLKRWMESNPVPEGIIVTYPLLYAAWLCLEFGKSKGIPVVVDIQDIWPEVFLTAFPKRLRGLARILLVGQFRQGKKIFRLADNCTAVSRYYLQYGESLKGTKFSYSQVYYLGYQPSSSDSDQLGLELLKVSGFEPSDVNFTFVGMLGSSYDISCVIRAARIIRSSYPSVKFIIAGDGPLKAQWQREAQGLDNVRFIGFVDSSRLGALLRHSFAGLVTYISGALQSIPNKPIEYVAYGLPVVNSLSGEFAELIENKRIGISYVPGNVESLIVAIKTFLDNPIFVSECRKNVQEVFAQLFSAQNIYPRFANDLEHLFKHGIHASTGD